MNPNAKKLKQQLAQLLEEKKNRKLYKRIDEYFPDTGKYRRELYSKHIEFMAKGLEFSERAFIAANRIGKSLTGGYEMTCHLTGIYPDWWKGKKFNKPISAWAAGITNEATRGVIQEILFGKIGHAGTGLIPKELIIKYSSRPGVPNAIGYAQIKHITGGTSEIELKSYIQGWETFQGAKKQVIWLDEEPKDSKIYSECLTRTAGDIGEEGIIYCTFTPLLGYSQILLSFIPGGKRPKNGIPPDSPQKYSCVTTWDDVPHLSAEWKKNTLASYAPFERDARTKGIPTQGSGAIYPVREEAILVEPFLIPDYWPKAYGMDFGWNKTAVVWVAQDPGSKVMFIYSEHYLGKQSYPMHAAAIKMRGDWICGVGDPAGGGSQGDGTTMFGEYNELGLLLLPARGGPNTKEPKIAKVLTLLETGQLKVFSTLKNWLDEFRVYRRNEDGKIIKENDHLMDATQYLISEWENVADVYPDEDTYKDTVDEMQGRSDVTGY